MTQKITALQRIRGIGTNFAAVLVREVLYRSFANRRQLASCVGIAPMPYQSGGMDRDRSISRGLVCSERPWTCKDRSMENRKGIGGPSG